MVNLNSKLEKCKNIVKEKVFLKKNTAKKQWDSGSTTGAFLLPQFQQKGKTSFASAQTPREHGVASVRDWIHRKTIPTETSESNRLIWGRREAEWSCWIENKGREGMKKNIKKFTLLVFIRFLNVTNLWVKFNTESGRNMATSYLFIGLGFHIKISPF